MNLAQISSSFIFITIITLLTYKKPNIYNNLSDICLPYYVIPVHYHIKLTHLYMGKYYFWAMSLNIKEEYDSFNFHGESSTTINILQSTQYIKLHMLMLIINNWSITLIKNNGVTYALKNYTETLETNLLEFHFSNVLSPGLYTLKMEFLGALTENSTQSFFKSFYTNKENGIAWLIASHIQPTGARRLFPCWDEPRLKATFTISINHHYSFTVLSNMPSRIHLLSDINDDFIWTHIYTTPPISTFQIAIVITNYSRIYINKNICLLCERCSEYDQSFKFKYARRIIENITLHLQSEFSGINIPKMDHVAIPNFPHDGMSKWGLIFHRETDLICDEQFDPVMRKMEVARLIASKIAYQWFSNVLSSHWSHFWLHDGLAILFAEKAVVKIFNNSEIMDFFIVQSQYESLHLASHFDMNPVQINKLSEFDSIFHFPSYIKVLIILRMYQTNITDEVFRENVHTYLYKHTFSSMIPYEIWSILRKKSNTNPYYMSNEFLNWIKFEHYPIVNWTQEINVSFGTLSQYFNETSYGKWWLPTSITTQFLYPRIFKIRLTSKEPFIYLNHKDNQGWILVGIKQSGYYRVNYNSENWYKIIYYLKSEQYKNINVISRAKIIDDAFHLAMSHQLDVSIFWELTEYLSQEINYVAWYPMIEVFEYISTVFPFPLHKFNRIDIKEKLKKLLNKPLKTLGFDENTMDNDFIKCLRQEAVKWACTLNHSECAIRAHQKLYHYLQNPEKYPVLSEWKQWTYCKNVLVVNINMCDELNVTLSRKSDHKLSPFLACCIIEHYNIAEDLPHLFNQFITSDEKQDIVIIRSQINIFFSIIIKFVNFHSTFRELLLNLPRIKPEEIKTLTAISVIINNIYYDGLLNYNFFEDIKGYINVKQFLMIQQKIITRNLEIKKHIEHFQDIVI